MRTLNFYQKGFNGISNFKAVAIPEWSNCETMVSVAKDLLTVLEGDYDYETLKNARETAKKAEAYYEDLARVEPDLVYPKPIVEGAEEIASSFSVLELYLDMAMWFFPESGRNTKVGNEEFHNQAMAEIKKQLKDMSEGVIVMTIPELGADRYFHTLNPQEDIYTLCGIDFYMWNGQIFNN